VVYLDRLLRSASNFISCGIQQDDATFTITVVIDAILPRLLAGRRGTARFHETVDRLCPIGTVTGTTLNSASATILATEDPDAHNYGILVRWIKAINVSSALPVGEALSSCAILVLSAIVSTTAWFTHLVTCFIKGKGSTISAIVINTVGNIVLA